MGNRRMGLGRMEKLLETVDRDLDLTNSTLTNCTITTNALGTFSGGILNSSITVSNATSADIDISTVTGDHKLFTTGTFAADIILPQATAANAGMCIQVMMTAASAASGTIRIGFLQSGSTVMEGIIVLSSTDALMDSIPLASAKVVLLDSDNVNLAGGAEGSMYSFYYQGLNKVFAYCNGAISAGTPALGAGAQSTTGIA